MVRIYLRTIVLLCKLFYYSGRKSGAIYVEWGNKKKDVRASRMLDRFDLCVFIGWRNDAVP
jgi:hypothetical protein